MKCWLESPLDLKKYSPLADSTGTLFDILKVRSTKPQEAVVTFKGVTTRNQSESLKGTEFFISRDRLKVPPEDDFYISDLIGLKALTDQGSHLGHVLFVHNFGAGDLVEIKPDQGETLMIPFTKMAVPSVDIEAGVITVSQEFLDSLLEDAKE